MQKTIQYNCIHYSRDNPCLGLPRIEDGDFGFPKCEYLDTILICACYILYSRAGFTFFVCHLDHGLSPMGRWHRFNVEVKLCFSSTAWNRTTLRHPVARAKTCCSRSTNSVPTRCCEPSFCNLSLAALLRKDRSKFLVQVCTPENTSEKQYQKYTLRNMRHRPAKRFLLQYPVSILVTVWKV